MNHKKAEEMLLKYLTATLNGKEKFELENHISRCKDCQKELKELKNIIAEIKRKPEVKIDEEIFEKTKYIAYKTLIKRRAVIPEFSPFVFPVVILSFMAFLFSNILLFQFSSKIFGYLSPFIFYTFLIYQFSGIVFFFFSLIIKFKGGFENGRLQRIL